MKRRKSKRLPRVGWGRGAGAVIHEGWRAPGGKRGVGVWLRFPAPKNLYVETCPRKLDTPSAALEHSGLEMRFKNY